MVQHHRSKALYEYRTSARVYAYAKLMPYCDVLRCLYPGIKE
ncbi:mitochondrial pyruvate dehydrogenase [Moniliophthora roreri]|nr:mitochondrial pyruvate dehydrogenase [Moniliophthora roreri]